MSAPHTPLSETLVKSDRLYEGRIINVRKDTVRTSGGVLSTREIVEHSPAVVIVPFVDPTHLVLVKQYRRAIDRVLIEFPAGMMNPGEAHLEAAKRELKEETGYSAATLHFLSENFPTPGFCDELFYMYLAQDMTLGDTQMDEDEEVETFIVSISEFESLINLQKIHDSKTLLGYLLARHYLGRHHD